MTANKYTLYLMALMVTPAYCKHTPWLYLFVFQLLIDASIFYIILYPKYVQNIQTRFLGTIWGAVSSLREGVTVLQADRKQPEQLKQAIAAAA